MTLDDWVADIMRCIDYTPRGITRLEYEKGIAIVEGRLHQRLVDWGITPIRSIRPPSQSTRNLPTDRRSGIRDYYETSSPETCPVCHNPSHPFDCR